MKTDRLLHALSYMTIAFAMGFMFWVAFLTLWPYDVIQVSPHPMPVVSNQVVPGGNFVYQPSVCVSKDIVSHFTPQLHNGTVLSFPTRVVNIKEGCSTTTSSNIVIPKNTAPGIYKFVFINEIQVNVIRTETVVFETEEFEVIHSFEGADAGVDGIVEAPINHFVFNIDIDTNKEEVAIVELFSDTGDQIVQQEVREPEPDSTLINLTGI